MRQGTIVGHVGDDTMRGRGQWKQHKVIRRQITQQEEGDEDAGG
jgi:hypothetical protein